jgi:hypothetical protein
MRPAGLDLLDDGEQVAGRAGEAIKSDHDQGLAGADLAPQARQHRPVAIGAEGMFLEHRVTAGVAQFIALRIGAWSSVETRA